MKITALVENESISTLKSKHGLSLYIETNHHKILFDLGPDITIIKNAQRKGIDLSLIDIVIISHGHLDHGGALKHFLKINSSAKIYIQKSAFESHYSKFMFIKVNIGLRKKYKDHPQLILLDGDYEINDYITLFTVSSIDKCYSMANDSLYANKTKDNFSHEQHMIIKDNQIALIMGCGHKGIINIMEKAKIFQPDICVGGYHLFNPITKKTVSNQLLEEITKGLKQYPETQFYTCHCTGKVAFNYMSQQLTNMHYLSCGDVIEI